MVTTNYRFRSPNPTTPFVGWNQSVFRSAAITRRQKIRTAARDTPFDQAFQALSNQREYPITCHLFRSNARSRIVKLPGPPLFPPLPATIRRRARAAIDARVVRDRWMGCILMRIAAFQRGSSLGNGCQDAPNWLRGLLTVWSVPGTSEAHSET